MKAGRFLVFVGACLLLANISTPLTLTPALKKEKSAFQTATSAENLHSVSAEPKRKCFFFFSQWGLINV